MDKKRLLVIAVCAFAAALMLRGIFAVVGFALPLKLAAVLPGGKISSAERSLRPNYPYSVISGGAYSPAELRYATEKDKVVRGHYADFDLKSARLVTLAADRFQYVSYRIKNNVLWTNRKLRIPKGEVLLTDGIHFARTRCGNRLSNVRPASAAFAAPLKSLSLPAFSRRLLAEGKVGLTPAPELNLPPEAALEFDLPTVAPFLPPAGPMTGTPSEVWPPMAVVPPLMAVVPGYAPNSPGSPLIPASPVSPFVPLESARHLPPPAIIAEVPEPASLYLFVVMLAVSLWVITRYLRPAPPGADTPTEDES